MTEMLTYRRLVSTWWWVRKRTYFVFVMRELSSIFIAWFVLYLLILVSAVSRGEAAYQDFVDFAEHPAVVAVNVVALTFVVLHTITWFNLTPKAMDVRLRSRPVPGWVVIVSQYVGLAVVSAFIVWLVLR
ncbi:MAG: fumarate reductase subunit C [Nocardioidaceae bacterium]